jgi:putative endonuclease
LPIVHIWIPAFAGMTVGWGPCNKLVIPAKAGIQYDGSMSKSPFVYLLASKKNGTLYVGVTSNLPGRIWQHKQGEVSGFTKKHRIQKLVWFEPHETMEAAITREKQIKEWKRAWKLELIEAGNPEWHDLYEDICL